MNSGRVCTSCALTKGSGDFYRKGDRLDSNCKECKRGSRRKRYISNNDKATFGRLIRIVDLVYENEGKLLDLMGDRLNAVLQRGESCKAKL